MLDRPFFALKAAWSALTKSPSGRVVVTALTASFVLRRTKAAYITAKHGVIARVRVAALEGKAHGLTVNAVAPGWMDTGAISYKLRRQP